MTRRSFFAWLLVVLAVASALRLVWLRADPPTVDVVGVGIVWHDEGAWTHNARNRALWGTWKTDEWNPVFVAPVFTALEYVSFRELGVGLWQARVVPAVSGLVAVIFLAAGLAAAGDRRTALIGSALLATNYAFVMWNRAALMESTMTAFIVVAWAAYAMAERRAGWAVVAGAAVALAWFTKAAAAFFAAAIVLDVVITLAMAWLPGWRARIGAAEPTRTQVRAAALTLASLAAAALAVGVMFVWPHWTEYRSTTGRCPCCASPSTTCGTCWTARRGCRSSSRSSCGCGWCSPPPRSRCWRSWRAGARRGRPSACWSCGSSSACWSSSCTTRATTGGT